MASFWKIVNKVIEQSDVILLLLDARIPEETLNTEAEGKIKKAKKPIIYVITKSDLIGQKRAEQYKKLFDPCVFISSKEYHGLKKLKERILIEGRRAGKKEVNVGVLGYPNVGKSSLINAMKGTHSASTSSESGHTKALQKIRASGRIVFIDTPGVIPYMEKDVLKHSLSGSTDFNKVKDPEAIAYDIMEKFPEKIASFYDIRLDDKEMALESLARKRNLLKKGALPDTMRAARMMIKDWQEGRIR